MNADVAPSPTDIAHERSIHSALALAVDITGAELALLATESQKTRWGRDDLADFELPMVPSIARYQATDVSENVNFRSLLQAGMRSFLGVPLVHSGVLRGTLWLISSRADAFDPQTQIRIDRLATTLVHSLPALVDQSQFQRLVDVIPVPAAYVHGENLYANPAIHELTGCQPGELTRVSDWFQMLSGDDSETARKMYEADRAAGFSEPRSVPLKRRDGQFKVVEIATSLLGEHELWLIHDITDRVASQERFRVLFEQSSTALVLYDETGIIDCNSSAVLLLEYEQKNDLLRKHPVDLSPKEQPDHHSSEEKGRQAEALANEKGTQKFNWTFQTAQGRPVVTQVSLTPLKVSQRSAWLGEWHDISERVAYEEGLKRARDSALQFAKAKADFLATMSHEIRTPMNGVIGMTRLLLDTELSIQQRDYVETVRACGEGLLALINDILDISKLEAGKVTLESIPFTLRDLLEDALSVVAQTAQGKGIDLLCYVDRHVPGVLKGDPTRMRQVLLNLLSNAVKFTMKGAVTLKVSGTASPDESGRSVISISVKDTGIGIAADALPRLFNAFSQEDSSTTRRFGGTGLGLAISKRLVGLMGGIIDVTTSSAGTTFTVSVGLEFVEANAGFPDFAGKNFWLVSHRPGPAEAIEALVRDTKAKILRVATKEESDRLSSPVDLVLIDSLFPEAIGLAKQLVEKNVRVGLLTQMGVLPPDLPTGLAFTMSQPVRRKQLFEQMKIALGRPDKASTPEVAVTPEVALSARILVAEDNLVNQRVVTGLLKKLGCQAVIVPNGRRAVEVVTAEQFDVILMDCQMPELDGFEATKQIRQTEKTRIPIIALTAGVLDGDRDRCKESGMDDFLAKPVRLEDLQAVLRKWVRAPS